MAAPQPDQRASRRFPYQLPVKVRCAQTGVDADAQTRDVSSRGICFYMDAPLDVGSGIEITLTLPPEITRTEAVLMRCKGRVVRVEHPDTSGKVAIAAQIDQYEFLGNQ